MASKTIIMYGADWCPDTRRAKRFFARHGIPYRWVDIEVDPEGEAIVLQLNNGRRVVPTILLPDGTVLSEPSDEALYAALRDVIHS